VRPPRRRALTRDQVAEQMIIVIDTREQLPYDFPCRTIRAKLDSGDYSILGYETQIAVERKQVAELFTCFGRERDRFEREFQRLQHYRRALVMIEGSFEECAIVPSSRSAVPPAVVINSLLSWYVRYGVAHVFAGSRPNAEACTYRILEHFFCQQIEGSSSSESTQEMQP
jgi:ERCC4-type nuclease